MLARTTFLSTCSTALVILVSAGVSAAFELNQVRTTHYGWLNNRCGSGNEMPGDCISTKGQTESFRANISSDGGFEHPTRSRWRRNACRGGERALSPAVVTFVQAISYLSLTWAGSGWKTRAVPARLGSPMPGQSLYGRRRRLEREFNRVTWISADRPYRSFTRRNRYRTP